ncbi:MAG: hypothetical protein Q9160_005768 [Pyrenula sp. 1 TL-2023]
MAALAASASDPERHSWFYRQRFGRYFRTQTPGHKRVISERFGAVAIEADETPAGKIQIHCRYDPEGQCRPSRHGSYLNYPLSYHVRPDVMVLCPPFWSLPTILWTLDHTLRDQVEILLTELLQLNPVYRPSTRFMQFHGTIRRVPEHMLRPTERLHDTRIHVRFAKAIYAETPPPYRDTGTLPPPLTPRPRPAPQRIPSPEPEAADEANTEEGEEAAPSDHMSIAHDAEYISDPDSIVLNVIDTE